MPRAGPGVELDCGLRIQSAFTWARWFRGLCPWFSYTCLSTSGEAEATKREAEQTVIKCA